MTRGAGAEPAEPLLRLRDVRVGYGRTQVIHGVSLSVATGGVTAVLGHNGAGKTTLLRAVVGLLRTAAGSVHLAGQDVGTLAPHRRIRLGMGYVPQGQQSFGQLTTAENLQLVADGVRDGQQRLDNSLEMFPALRPVLGRRSGLLSGGQRQQLAIARALITTPKLLILDEPTEGIQPSVVSQIEDAILSLVEQFGISVLLVEQHVGFALAAADEYYVLQSGRVSDYGPGGTEREAHVRGALAI